MGLSKINELLSLENLVRVLRLIFRWFGTHQLIQILWLFVYLVYLVCLIYLEQMIWIFVNRSLGPSRSRSNESQPLQKKMKGKGNGKASDVLWSKTFTRIISVITVVIPNNEYRARMTLITPV